LDTGSSTPPILMGKGTKISFSAVNEV